MTSPIVLRQTCPACPEQYDAYDDGSLVGYLRLRHGRFTVSYPDPGGVLIYEAYPRGDGIFVRDEREEYLRRAVHAIRRYRATGETSLRDPIRYDTDYEVTIDE